jgi:hypothetical protein
MQVKVHTGEHVECEKVVHMAWTRPDVEVDRRTRDLVIKTRRSYSEAMRIVLDEDEILKQAFARQPFDENRREARRSVLRFGDGTSIARDVFRHDNATPGVEVDRLTKAKMKAEKLTYSQAMEAVLSDPENVALKEAYVREGRD